MEYKMNDVAKMIENVKELEVVSDDGWVWMKFNKEDGFTADSPFDDPECIQLSTNDHSITFFSKAIVGLSHIENVCMSIQIETGIYQERIKHNGY